MPRTLKNFDWKLYKALLLMALFPTVWTTFRIFLIGALPDGASYSIAGQLSIVNLIYEIFNEAIILPIFYFLGETKKDKARFINRLKTGLLTIGAIYTILSLTVIAFTPSFLRLVSCDSSIIEQSVAYIRIECVANIFDILLRFVIVAMTITCEAKEIYLFTLFKMLLLVFSDTLLVSNLRFSLKLGINGIGYSNIWVNLILLIVVLLILRGAGYSVFSRGEMSFAWITMLAKIGGISGLESFVRNFAYMFMIQRMVNVVGEQGTYWVANSFIWSWLLLPVVQLGELIKKEVSENSARIEDRTVYYKLSGIICASWFILMPFYKPFMRHILGFDNVDKLFTLVLILIGFYVLFAFQNVFDSIFYGRGKTNYMLLESLITNVIYYGACFILYITGVFVPSLYGIALMFGIGTAFDSVCSYILFRKYLRSHSN